MCQDLMLINIHACIYSTSNDYVIVSPFLINCKDIYGIVYRMELSVWFDVQVDKIYSTKMIFVCSTDTENYYNYIKVRRFHFKKSVFCTWRFAEACLADKSILMRASQNLCNMHRGNSGEHLGCIQDYSS